MKGKYSKERNEIRELPTMERPLLYGNYLYPQISHEVMLTKGEEHECKKYEDHITNLRSIPCSPDIKWEDGREVEEGKDFWIDDLFSIGSKVKCLFGNSGNKFWFTTKEILTVVKTSSEQRRPHKLFFGRSPTHFFYSNDFELIEGSIIPTAIPLPAIKDEQEKLWEEVFNDYSERYVENPWLSKKSFIETLMLTYSLTRK